MNFALNYYNPVIIIDISEILVYSISIVLMCGIFRRTKYSATERFRMVN